MSDNLPITSFIGMPLVPQSPKQRSNTVIGRFFTNWELEQNKTRATLQADTMEQMLRYVKHQQDIFINIGTANQRFKTEVTELEARATIAEAKADEAALSALEKRFEFRLKKKSIEEALGEIENR